MKKNQPASRFVIGRAEKGTPPRPRRRLRAGLTLAELLVATVIVAIVILALGTTVADSVRGWHRMYGRVYADVRTDSFVARKTFDQVIRKATRQMCLVDSAGAWLEVYYYSNSSASVIDSYALFKTASGALLVERGEWKAGVKSPLRTDIVCENVASCVFKADGRSAQMLLTLDDGSQNIVVATSAVMHNSS